jgi:hypothetical protein
MYESIHIKLENELSETAHNPIQFPLFFQPTLIRSSSFQSFISNPISDLLPQVAFRSGKMSKSRALARLWLDSAVEMPTSSLTFVQ